MKRNILIAVKELKQRLLLSGLFADLGMHSKTATDGKDALVKTLSGSFGLVIMDNRLPELDALSFVTKVTAEISECAVLFISDEVSVEEAISLMRAGATDFLVNPVSGDQVKLVVDKVFGEIPGVTETPKSPEKKKSYEIVTQDAGMRRLLGMVEKIADSTASVLIQGESGTGKELIARFIHEKSGRRRGPFVAINCAALPENLLESELFGHEKGAFTGAMGRKQGKFELAHGGTLLLDEITEMQLHLQSKLLRVVQEKELERVGGSQVINVDVRILATTNRNIKETVANGGFREDLYYRLSTIPVKVPSMRERTGDLKHLVSYFIEKFNKIDGRSVKGMTTSALDRLSRHPFEGNVRELENIIHRSVLLSDGKMIGMDDLMMDDEIPREPISGVEKIQTSDHGIPFSFEPGPLKDVEEKLIYHTLDKTSGNRTHAAKILGISVRTLRNKLNEYKGKEVG